MSAIFPGAPPPAPIPGPAGESSTPSPGKVVIGTTSYDTIAAALSAASSGDVVVVGSGIWYENITVPDGVKLLGFPITTSVSILGADTTSTRVTLGAGCTLREVLVKGPSSGSNPAIASNNATGANILFNVRLEADGGSGAMVEKTGTGALILQLVGFNAGTTTGAIVDATAGLVRIIGGGINANAGTANEFLKFGGTVTVEGQLVQVGPPMNLTDVIEIGGTAVVGLSNVIFPNAGAGTVTNGIHIAADGISLTMDGPPLRTDLYDVLIDPALVGTGTKINIVAESDYSKFSIPSGYRDTAETRFNFGTVTGWASYTDTTHTSGSPQALTASTRAQWSNDAGTTLNEYRPGNTELWDSNEIKPSNVGEAYTIRVDFVIQPAQTNGVLTLDLDIGSDPFGASSIVIMTDTLPLSKGTAAQKISRSFTVYCLATFLANGGAIGIECDKNADIYDKVITIVRIH